MYTWYPDKVEVTVLLLLDKEQRKLNARELVVISDQRITRFRLRQRLEQMRASGHLCSDDADTDDEAGPSYHIGPKGVVMLNGLKLLEVTLEKIPLVKRRVRAKRKTVAALLATYQKSADRHV